MLYTMYEKPAVLDHTGEVWFEIFRTFIGIRANRWLVLFLILDPEKYHIIVIRAMKLLQAIVEFVVKVFVSDNFTTHSQ